MLLVGAGPEWQSLLRHRFTAPPWSLTEVASGSAALAQIVQRSFELVLVAPVLPDLDPEELQQLIRDQRPGVQVLQLGGQPATSRGPGAQLLGELLDMHGRSQQRAPVLPVGTVPAADRTSWEGILGGSPAMQRVFQTAAMVARRSTTVLVQGESGTGKDLLARGIHNAGPRARQPFVVINCAAIPEALLESELFGFTKGAFTGASQSRLGRVHAANGGTLFLDEIGDMPLPLQSKILRFLEQGEVQRIGGSETLKVDCRIIAATNVDLQRQVKERCFREDLYYRLAVLPIAMPPLRDRMEDLPMLCASFLERFAPGSKLSEGAEEVLRQHTWPGNVRELRNVMERASLFAADRGEVLPEDVVL